MGAVSEDRELLIKRFAPVVNFSPVYRFLQLLFFLVYSPLIIIYNFVVFGLKIEGRENLKRASQRGCILISNHSLYLDPAVISNTFFPHRCYYFALKSHFHHPLGGAIIRLMGGIPIPDVREMRRAEKTTRKALDRGYNVLFFPEGEMNHLSQEVAPFQSGAFYQALHLNATIIPVTLIHRPRVVFGKEISKYFIRVKCIVGEPFEPTKNENEKLRDAAKRIATQAHQTMTDTIISGHQTL
ncbi:MAG: lysophospholipid acyltransferase family protein [Desulfobacterales bacterium]|nr:lysophospholipid acyltransferase family protein [Desulfobacterales bacterium]